MFFGECERLLFCNLSPFLVFSPVTLKRRGFLSGRAPPAPMVNELAKLGRTPLHAAAGRNPAGPILLFLLRLWPHPLLWCPG